MIPEYLSHLKVDQTRGFVIPYFVPIVEGCPNFLYADPDKAEACFRYKKCWICGLKIKGKISWIITGPIGLQNTVSSDAPMHRHCAEYSLKACPHLAIEKARRRTLEEEASSHHVHTKPNRLYLVGIDKFKIFKHERQILFKYRSAMIIEYSYKDGKLEIK